MWYYDPSKLYVINIDKKINIFRIDKKIIKILKIKKTWAN
jgi:hypothetical protein